MSLVYWVVRWQGVGLGEDGGQGQGWLVGVFRQPEALVPRGSTTP